MLTCLETVVSALSLQANLIQLIPRLRIGRTTKKNTGRQK
jgi:hypothetical protein